MSYKRFLSKFLERGATSFVAQPLIGAPLSKALDFYEN
jgi:hypothetical protein